MKPDRTLSDPFGDFQDNVSLNMLNAICNKAPSDLNYADFLVVFQSYCPAGTIQECLPFTLPLFRYIRRKIIVEGSSRILSVWQEFLSWYKNNVCEIKKLNKDIQIESEIEKLFSYIGGICWSEGMTYSVIYSISGILKSYVDIIVEDSAKAQ